MICGSCKKAPKRQKKSSQKFWHDRCEYPASCPCQHKLDAEYVKE